MLNILFPPFHYFQFFFVRAIYLFIYLSIYLKTLLTKLTIQTQGDKENLNAPVKCVFIAFKVWLAFPFGCLFVFAFITIKNNTFKMF